MFLYTAEATYAVSDCNETQSTGTECSQCIDCNCVDDNGDDDE